VLVRAAVVDASAVVNAAVVDDTPVRDATLVLVAYAAEVLRLAVDVD
jgi:hypothetical protein